MEKNTGIFEYMASGSEADMGSGGPQSQSSGDDESSESLDDDPSSSTKPVDELANFRSQWKQELDKNKLTPNSTCGDNSAVETDCCSSNVEELEKSDEEKAKEFFNQGVYAEEAGLLYEAVSFYKKAVQLVPDIEFRMSEQSVKPREKKPNCSSPDDSDVELDDYGNEDLTVRFQLQMEKNDGSYFEPTIEQRGAHILNLPVEVLVYILKWVVSVDLDLKSLEQFSLACKGFYVCARDEEIWRLVCIRIWGLKCASRSSYKSWRQMFLEKNHLRFNGCYISKTTYIRHGETSYIDENFRPWYLVEYYRYLRFFPDGMVLMLTTPDNPYSALYKLRSRAPRFPSIMIGHYRYNENRVTAVLKKRNVNANINSTANRRRRKVSIDDNDSGEQSFHVEFEVDHVKKGRNYKLNWKHYSVRTQYKNGQDSVANFDLSSNNFTPFIFSLVRSYLALSEKPLV